MAGPLRASLPCAAQRSPAIFPAALGRPVDRCRPPPRVWTPLTPYPRQMVPLCAGQACVCPGQPAAARHCSRRPGARLRGERQSAGRASFPARFEARFKGDFPRVTFFPIHPHLTLFYTRLRAAPELKSIGRSGGVDSGTILSCPAKPQAPPTISEGSLSVGPFKIPQARSMEKSGS